MNVIVLRSEPQRPHAKLGHITKSNRVRRPVLTTFHIVPLRIRFSRHVGMDFLVDTTRR